MIPAAVVVHFQLLPYLVAVGNVAARDRTELAAQFRLPNSSANNVAFLTAVKALVAAAEVSDFETASEEARAKRLSHIGARGDLQEIAGELMEEVRVLDGINRWRFARIPR